MSDAKHILIVDDEPNVRLVFRTALESAEYAQSTAEDGESALEALKAGGRCAVARPDAPVDSDPAASPLSRRIDP